MFAGHFGIAASVKGKASELPIWLLIISSQLLDIVFIPLSLFGLEEIGPKIEGGAGNIIYAEYSHSLVGAILLSFIAGFLTARFFSRRSGVIIFFVSFSHWILDLIVHVSDMPLLPGNIGDFMYFGFGLWKYPVASLLLEGTLIVLGAILYFRYTYFKAGGKWKNTVIMKGSLMTLFLLLSFWSGI